MTEYIVRDNCIYNFVNILLDLCVICLLCCHVKCISYCRIAVPKRLQKNPQETKITDLLTTRYELYTDYCYI